jgi:hypothetical protein
MGVDRLSEKLGHMMPTIKITDERRTQDNNTHRSFDISTMSRLARWGAHRGASICQQMTTPKVVANYFFSLKNAVSAIISKETLKLVPSPTIGNGTSVQSTLDTLKVC